MTLVELGRVTAWVRWLREQFRAAEQTAEEMTRRELARTEPASDEEAAAPKWQVKCRFESASHSIRPQPLRWWNEVSDWIKLHPVPGRPDQLIVHLELPRQISIHALWWTGLGQTQRLLAALNIGTMGFFWFDMPEKVSQFYEEIRDLETNERTVVRRTPALRIDWGNNVLSEDDLSRVAFCFGSIPGPADQARHAPFDHYMAALGFLAKTDVVMQFEANAFDCLYRAFKAAARIYGHWEGEGSFVSAFDAILSTHLSEPDRRASFIQKAALIEEGRQRDLQVDLSDVGGMKVLTDSFLLRLLRDDNQPEDPKTDTSAG